MQSGYPLKLATKQHKAARCEINAVSVYYPPILKACKKVVFTHQPKAVKVLIFNTLRYKIITILFA